MTSGRDMTRTIYWRRDVSKSIEKLMTSGHDAMHTIYCEPAITQPPMESDKGSDVYFSLCL